MNIDATYKRAVRIISNPGEPYGHGITIYDKATGEVLSAVKSASIYLDVAEVSTVKLTFYETNEQGNIITDEHHKPIIREITIISEQHEIDITAFEV